jgi:hypothetical protein
MPDKPKKDALAPCSRPVKHGLYSWISSKKVPGGRAFQAVRRDLTTMRAELLEAHGGEGVTPDAKILIDAVVEAAGVTKILGLYVRKYGVVDARAAKRGSLELTPLLAKSWVSYNNAVRQGLLALKELEKGRQTASQADVEAILTSYCRQEEESAKDGQGSAQDRVQETPGVQTEACEGQRETGGSASIIARSK